MNEGHKELVERIIVGDVAAIFRLRDALDAAADALLLAGFDQADLNLVAEVNPAQKRLGTMVVGTEMAHASSAEHSGRSAESRGKAGVWTSNRVSYSAEQP